MTDDATPLRRAIRLAAENVAAGGGPFGAVLVRDGTVIAEGQNRVTRDLDPSAHAEVVAIRFACRVIGSFSLSGMTLYSSCEPCPMCLATALWARVDRVVYAADRDAAAAGGFDDRAFYDCFAAPRSEWTVPVLSHPLPEAFDPFARWLADDARTRY